MRTKKQSACEQNGTDPVYRAKSRLPAIAAQGHHPCRSRITVAEVPVHIIQRGNNRGACCFADADDELYLAHLKALAAKFACAVHATCLQYALRAYRTTSRRDPELR
jgi:hypothetical protein